MQIEEFKSHFNSDSKYVHFNNAGQALIPDVNRDLSKKWLERFYSEGSFCALEGWNQTEIVRQKLANFLGAECEEVSFFTTTASALSQAAMGIDLHADDEILIWDQEYPSNFYPWRKVAEKNGARLVQVESENWKTPAQRILDHVTSKTRVIAISWVQYQTGSVTDLKMISEALKGREIWLVADIIQGAGVRPFNFKESGFDIVCGGSHKWLCSSYGAGYMIVKKNRLLDLEPLEVGAMTYGMPETEKSFAIQPKLDSRRFEPGSKAMIEIIALGATLDLFVHFSAKNIFAEASRIGYRLHQELESIGYQVISEGPIINFFDNNKNRFDKIIKLLEQNQIAYAKRGPGIRLSVHAYNKDSEVDKVIQLLQF